MRWISQWLATGCLVFITLSFGYGQIPNNLPTDKFFNQIVGTWKLNNRPVLEQWTQATSGSFQARVLDLSKGDSTLTETIKVVKDKGQVCFVAKVLEQNDGKPIKFRLAKKRKKKVIFINEKHDFPQKIEYRLKSTQTLQVQISGVVRKKVRKITFVYQRIK
ncbi:DUF6265 family protein [uncultured Microscilla sp.]|uniref:DUF6265 family protein n=1 Tax=uncultured Microscilla sp. TaxID=432653 RepID=UPI002637D129|nr:DUF6265 family protein [uncultured Microscilla sp.]